MKPESGCVETETWSSAIFIVVDARGVMNSIGEERVADGMIAVSFAGENVDDDDFGRQRRYGKVSSHARNADLSER